MLISVAAAVLFIVNIWRRGWVFPIIAVGLWGFISIVVGTIYPGGHPALRGAAERVRHASSRTSSATSTATRAAFGLDERSRRSTFNYNADARPRPTTVGGQADARQRAALRPAARAATTFKVDAGVRRPSTRSPTSTSTATRSATRTSKPIARVGARARPRAPPDNSWTNQHLVYTHGYGAVAAAANAVNADQPSYLLSDIPPDGRARSSIRSTPGVYFGEGLSGYAVVDTKVAEQEATSERRHEGHHVHGQRRRAGVELPAQGRARAALRRLEPVRVSGQVTNELARHLPPRRQAARADGRAVPEVRRRPVPGRASTAGSVGARRVHDDERLPVLAVDPPAGAGRERSRHRLQLRAQLGEGDRRRVRRHRSTSTSSTRRTRSSRRTARRSRSCSSDVEHDAAGPARALALPGRHLQRADRAVHAVPHDRSGAVLQQAGDLGHRAEPRHVERGRGRVRGREREQRRPQHDARRRRAARSIRCT